MVRIIWLVVALLSCPRAIADDRGSVIIADLRSEKVIYETEGKQKDLDGTIVVLRERATRTGIGPYNDVAIVLASEKLSLRQVQDLHATLQAYGFRDIRLFVFGSDKLRLRDFSLGSKGFTFTRDRAELMRAIGASK